MTTRRSGTVAAGREGARRERRGDGDDSRARRPGRPRRTGRRVLEDDDLRRGHAQPRRRGKVGIRVQACPARHRRRRPGTAGSGKPPRAGGPWPARGTLTWPRPTAPRRARPPASRRAGDGPGRPRRLELELLQPGRARPSSRSRLDPPPEGVLRPHAVDAWPAAPRWAGRAPGQLVPRPLDRHEGVDEHAVAVEDDRGEGQAQRGPRGTVGPHGTGGSGGDGGQERTRRRRGGRPSPDRPAGPGTRPRPTRRSAYRPRPPPPHRRSTGRCRAPVSTSTCSSGRPEQVPQLGRRAAAGGQGPDDRQGVDALDEVVAGRLAELRLGGGQVEHVVDDLEGHAEGVAEAGQRLDLGPVEAGHERADAARGGEQRRRLAADRLQVLGLGPARRCRSVRSSPIWP